MRSTIGLSTPAIWDAAAEVDESVALRPRLLRRVLARHITPQPFSRTALYKRLSRGEPSLWTRVPISTPDINVPERILEEVRRGFSSHTRARVRFPTGVRHLTIGRVVHIWEQQATLFNVPDLHYIGTRFDRRVDTKALNDFNMLPRGTDGFQSQDSLVLSAKGAFTDSHSDDHSGSNHCFVGSKLWLMWDTVEGLARGLEDVERGTVTGRAAFDLETFVSLPSARWILICPGQTIFLPGHLTHKVITLEPYVGLGSFFVALANYLDALQRWQSLVPVWALDERRKGPRSIATVNRNVIRGVLRLLRQPRAVQRHWGVHYLVDGLKSFRRPHRASLSRGDYIDAIVTAIDS